MTEFLNADLPTRTDEELFNFGDAEAQARASLARLLPGGSGMVVATPLPPQQAEWLRLNEDATEAVRRVALEKADALYEEELLRRLDDD